MQYNAVIKISIPYSACICSTVLVSAVEYIAAVELSVPYNLLCAAVSAADNF